MDELDYEVYEFIKDVLKHVSVLTVKQCILFIVNQYETTINAQYAEMILREMQGAGYILISEDGYVMTKGAYTRITGDIFRNNLLTGYSARVPAGIDYTKCRDGKEVMDCMWLYASMLPNVTDICVKCGCWDLMMVIRAHDDKPPKLFQVAKFNYGEEGIKAEYVRAYNNAYAPDDKNQIRRVALLDNDKYISLVPKKCGFEIVAVLDDKRPSNYRIVERYTTAQAWGD